MEDSLIDPVENILNEKEIFYVNIQKYLFPKHIDIPEIIDIIYGYWYIPFSIHVPLKDWFNTTPPLWRLYNHIKIKINFIT